MPHVAAVLRLGTGIAPATPACQGGAPRRPPAGGVDDDPRPVAWGLARGAATGKRSTFFTDPGMNSMTRAVLGRVHTGAADAGEAMRTVDRITDGDNASWAREWEATADRIGAVGDDCLRRGHRVSGRNALVRAATYYTACVVVADVCDEPLTVLARTFAAYRRCWEQYLGLLDNPPERLDIAYEGTTMPGWFFAAGGDGPKPTLMVASGADGALSYLWPGYGSEAAARGYNVVLFDGPGQQRMLFERGIPFRPDWEHVVGPVVDAALRRRHVDPQRLAFYAVSQHRRAGRRRADRGGPVRHARATGRRPVRDHGPSRRHAW